MNTVNWEKILVENNVHWNKMIKYESCYSAKVVVEDDIH